MKTEHGHGRQKENFGKENIDKESDRKATRKKAGEEIGFHCEKATGTGCDPTQQGG